MRIQGVEMRKVAVIADGTCCLPADLVRTLDIKLVPLLIWHKDRSYKDGIEITPAEVYKIMRRREEMPTTSTPSPGDFMEAYRQASLKTENVICITLTSRQSKVFDSALLARALIEDDLSDTSIEIVDSRAVAGALGFVVLAAARAASEGADLAEVTRVAREMIPRVNMLAMVDTLFYLARTGRVGRAAEWVGSILDMKPILEHNTSVGETAPVARPRTRAKAMKQLTEMFAERVGDSLVHVNIHHADEREAGEKLSAEIAAKFNCAEILLTEFTPGMGVHAGPGVIGMSFFTE